MERAELNGAQGHGSAEISRGPSGRKQCDGAFYPDEAEAGKLIGIQAGSGTAMFTGIVRDHGRKTRLTFEVIITRAQIGSSGNVAYFTATGDPYKSRSPEEK